MKTKFFSLKTTLLLATVTLGMAASATSIVSADQSTTTQITTETSKETEWTHAQETKELLTLIPKSSLTDAEKTNFTTAVKKAAKYDATLDKLDKEIEAKEDSQLSDYYKASEAAYADNESTWEKFYTAQDETSKSSDSSDTTETDKEPTTEEATKTLISEINASTALNDKEKVALVKDANEAAEVEKTYASQLKAFESSVASLEKDYQTAKDAKEAIFKKYKVSDSQWETVYANNQESSK
ncbi:hypothetical protein [Streptococcus saliviloxodontae]|uniref:Uncharacterized protein n=1 Tax=Streptococcus saliviloxodontae TaxID=1349416 RepID=A0ABS2PK90_9STRE|nr:hypothetical protein [Streptococcus saliviloxodontae]MBM7635682.1 hypothetical protein [Streptococcus saliviloxodontae]